MPRFEDGGRAALSKAVLWIMYLGSAAISALWFAREMPGLFMDEAAYPIVAPLLSGVFGVASMELAVLAWNYQAKQVSLSSGQYWSAYFGLITALGMSVLTSFAAVMAFVGNGSDQVGDFIVAFVTQNGMAYYIGLQLILVTLFSFMFDEGAADAKGRNRKQAKPTVTTVSAPVQSAQLPGQRGPEGNPPRPTQVQSQDQRQARPKP